MTAVMPAGTYYVGDTCYVMHDAWNECCRLFFEGRDDHGCNEGVFQLEDGRKFANFNTTYGDGGYPSSIDTTFYVYSGTIGCIKLEDIRDESTSMEEMKGLGAIVTFEEDFVVTKNLNTIHIGHVEVYTGHDPYYEEEDEDYQLYDEDDF